MKISLFFLVLSFVGIKAHSQTTGDSAYKTADSLYRNKNYAQAKEAYTNAMTFYQNMKIQLSFLHMYRSRCARQLDDYDSALSDVNQAIKFDGTNRDAYWDRAIIYSDMKKANLAIKDFNTAIPLYKNNSIYLSRIFDGRARQEYIIGNFENSIKDDSIALAINPKNGSAYWHRGTTFYKMGQFQRAADDYTASIAYHDDIEDWASLYYNRGNSFKSLNNYLKAINDYNQAIELNPNDPFYYLERGITYSKNGDYQLAIDDFTKTISLPLQDTMFLARLYYNIGSNKIKMLQNQDAIEYLNKAIELNPNNAAYYYLLGEAYANTSIYKSSEMNYLKAITLAKSNKKLLSLIYASYENINLLSADYQRTINNANISIILDPMMVSSYYYRARAYLKLGETKKAMSDIKKIISVDETKNTSEYIFSLHYLGNDNQAIETMKNRILITTNGYDKIVQYYNMACLYSLMKKENESIIYLKLAFEGGYPKRYALDDIDFDNIRTTESFTKLLGN